MMMVVVVVVVVVRVGKLLVAKIIRRKAWSMCSV